MKKIIIVIIPVVLLLICTGVYFIIPAKLTINNRLTIEASDAVTSRFLIHKSEWIKWWPGKISGPNQFYYKGTLYIIKKTINSGAYISIQNKNSALNSTITYLADDEATSKITWYAEKEASLNPFRRITDNSNNKELNKQIIEILQHLKTFLENRKNAYGYNLYIGKVKDAVMLTTTAHLNNYPDMGYVYLIINGLKKQAAIRGATETNYPMLNVNKTDARHYDVTVAIPINKTIVPAQNYTVNNMVMGGNLLVADVKGGSNTTKDALSQLKIFMKDHHLISPAMPFESLVTDRSVERDTTKWVTKLYYPIF